MVISHYSFRSAMKNLIIVGAGDLGKEVLWLVEDINRVNPTYVVLGFLDDDENKSEWKYHGYSILGKTEQLEKLCNERNAYAVIAVQYGHIRKRIMNSHPGFDRWESLLHPTVVIASSSQLGKGSVLFPYTVISVDTTAGDSLLCYIGVNICNDCLIGDYVSLMTGVAVSEHAEIGEEAYISSGATICPGKKIGKRANVGTGVTVVKNCGDGELVVNDGESLLFK